MNSADLLLVIFYFITQMSQTHPKWLQGPNMAIIEYYLNWVISICSQLKFDCQYGLSLKLEAPELLFFYC